MASRFDRPDPSEDEEYCNGLSEPRDERECEADLPDRRLCGWCGVELSLKLSRLERYCSLACEFEAEKGY